MAVLFLLFATAMAFGTFIESWYSTETARIWIYNTHWFEAIMVFFMINFIGNIFRYRLLRREKLAVLVLHLSWILIIVGAFVTRYISFEGRMPIREGNTENVFYSDKTYLTVYVDGQMNGETKRKILEEEIIATPEALKSSLPWHNDFNGQPFNVSYAGFIDGAHKGLVPDPNGQAYLKIVEAGDGQRHEHYLQDGQVASIHNILFALNQPTEGAINLTATDSTYTISSPFAGSFMRMADQFQGDVVTDSVQKLQLRSLYQMAGIQFVIPEPIVKGNYEVVPIPKDQRTKEMDDALILNITSGGKTVTKKVLGGKGATNFTDKFTLNGLDFSIKYGSKIYQLPFGITLNDFIAEKYPGTEKGYASFMSKITVNDDKPFDYDIFMNHVLDHKGYRFFQASFDPDERGTVLSVNHDFWGTWITYIGYTLLYIGLLGIMFYGKTRFKDLIQSLKKVNKQKVAMVTLFLGLGSFSAQAQEESHDHIMGPSKEVVDSILQTTKVSKEHADKFARLVIQDEGGRMKPINTYASELLRKLSLKDSYEDMDADQVFLSMMLNPTLWYHVDFMILDKKSQNDSLRNIIGIPKGQKYLRAADFFDNQGNYKLAPYLEDAYRTQTPNQFQKDFKEADLRLGLLNQALQGDLFRIFPLMHDENNKWISTTDYTNEQAKVQDSLYANFVKNAVPFYLANVQNAINTGNYAEADKMLEAFKQNQINYGKEVLPSDAKITTEIIYNRLDLFNRLYQYYMLIGLLMFIVLIIRIFKDREIWKVATYFFTGLLILFFIWHTAGLIMRAYVSGHAPWSDAYESIVYVAWATMGMGLFLGRKSSMAIAATAFVTSMLMWIAHMNWIDPSIANLQPVLDSYWLMIHTAIIVGSYGPLSVGMMLGVVCLLLILFTTEKNKARMEHNLQELTIINEMALTVGLAMLTIGTFLGGQWANESWGRYWGWDPKETWALISVMVYAFVIHARLVPGLRGKWTFNFMSVLAFGSIMMTYFGVNFYLVGLHSYASGDKMITPMFVWYTVIGVFVFGALSLWRHRVIYTKK